MPTIRKKRRTALSLFAFQDIITSVTAIMILLVLILTLELVTRTQSRGVAAEDRRVAKELREAVAALEARADTLRSEQRDVARAASRAAGMSAEEITRRRDEAERSARLLAEENAVLAARVRAARADQRNAERGLIDAGPSAAEALQGHAVALEKRASEMEEANKSERQRQEAAGSSQGQPTAGTLVFNRDPGNPRTPVLVAASATGLDILDGGEAGLQHFPWRAGRPDRNFNRWLKELDSSNSYVVVLLRPSAIDNYQAVREAVTTAGLGIGLELVGESTNVVLPTSGSDDS